MEIEKPKSALQIIVAQGRADYEKLVEKSMSIAVTQVPQLVRKAVSLGENTATITAEHGIQAMNDALLRLYPDIRILTSLATNSIGEYTYAKFTWDM
jgi:hypothetical protein